MTYLGRTVGGSQVRRKLGWWKGKVGKPGETSLICPEQETPRDIGQCFCTAASLGNTPKYQCHRITTLGGVSALGMSGSDAGLDQPQMPSIGTLRDASIQS